jgi:UDP-N-acetyl-D-mannosaminuronate dehydrogenase
VNVLHGRKSISWAKSVLPLFIGASSETLRKVPDPVQIDTTLNRQNCIQNHAVKGRRPLLNRTAVIVGITFKEDVPDLRNSRVPDIVAGLREFGITPLVTDPLADPAEAKREYDIELVSLEHFTELDGLILAVPHRVLGEVGWEALFAALSPGGVFVDVKSVVARDKVPRNAEYWSL